MATPLVWQPEELSPAAEVQVWVRLDDRGPRQPFERRFIQGAQLLLGIQPDELLDDVEQVTPEVAIAQQKVRALLA